MEVSTDTRDIESPGVTGSRDLPVMGAGSQTWILCKSSAHSYPSPAPETLKARGRALKSWVMGAEDIRHVPGGDQFKWKALAITVFCTSTVYVKAMQTDFFFKTLDLFLT